MKRVLPWVAPIAIILLWQAASQFGLLRPQVLPAPSSVASAAWRLARSGELWSNIEVSTWRATVGFAIGGGIGFALGSLNGLSSLSETLTGQHAADDPQHPASGADPAGDPVVRHR